MRRKTRRLDKETKDVLKDYSQNNEMKEEILISRRDTLAVEFHM